MSDSPESILRRAEPLDYVASLACADILEESGNLLSSHLQRGRGWLLAWASMAGGSLDRIVGRRGCGFKMAYFSSPQPGVPRRLRQDESPAIVFRSRNYDVCGEYGDYETSVDAREGRVPWMRPRRKLYFERFRDIDVSPDVPIIWRGASVADFVRALEIAEAVWFPIQV